MANERALGPSSIWAAQTRPQLSAIFGEQEARTLLGLRNNLSLSGGSKDDAFNQEISDLLGQVRVARTTWQTGQIAGRNVIAEDIPILTGVEVRQLEEGRALVVAENGQPIIDKLRRRSKGHDGQGAARPASRHAGPPAPEPTRLSITSQAVWFRRAGTATTALEYRQHARPAR